MSKSFDWDGAPFGGAKGALVFQDRLVVLRRDDLPDLPWAGLIDLPGGGREKPESPMETFLREVREEVGLVLPQERLNGARTNINARGKVVWFFTCPITQDESQSLVLGSEGQACWMMPIADFLTAPDAIPHLQDNVRAMLG